MRRSAYASRVTISTLLVVGVLLVGCESRAAVDPPDIGVGAPSKYYSSETSTGVVASASIRDVEDKIGFTPRTPTIRVTKSGRELGVLKRVLVRNFDEGAELSKEERSVDLEYREFVIAQVPFPSADAAKAYANLRSQGKQAKRYIKKVTVAGIPALAWNRVELPYTVDADGNEQLGMSIPSSAVIWADGAMVYRIGSDTLEYPELLEIVNSLP